MPDLNAQVADVLNNDPVLTALVGTQIWNIRRREIDDKPSLVYRRVSTTVVDSSQGANSLAGANYQLDGYARSLDESSRIALAAYDSLKGAFSAVYTTRRDNYLPVECAYMVSIDTTVWGVED